jgi:glutathione synthase/RimK-type ligase-like ATP-grasp enzyme
MEEAGRLGIGLNVVSMEDLVRIDFEVNVKEYDSLYIRNPYLNAGAEKLPQIIKLAKKFKNSGKKVVDSVIGDGQLGEGKWVDYQKLAKAKLPIPATICLGKNNLKKLKYSLVLKWIYGFKAENVFYVRDEDQLAKLLPKHPLKEWLAQEFLPADYEYKVMVVGHRSVPIVLRFEIRTDGFGIKYRTGKAVRASTIPKVVSLAEKASRLLGRELTKVDILYSGGLYYILEVNRFPGIKPFENFTKMNLAAKFIEYVRKA